MSQDQPRRPEQGQAGREPIKYGDAFDVSGDIASKAIAPQDAAMMQTAEAVVFGQTHKGGPAAIMQSAATRNERAGLVGCRDVTDVTMDQGVTVTETDVPGQRIITESVAGQSPITFGEALEAAAQMAGEKLVDQSDPAAIQAAEVRATGSNVIGPGDWPLLLNLWRLTRRARQKAAVWQGGDEARCGRGGGGSRGTTPTSLRSQVVWWPRLPLPLDSTKLSTLKTKEFGEEEALRL
ncbi:hypothetical protein NL676_020955 [Syzygium grande]|nr:hypothetical protein NL676_020955 [Syzygium grande]